MASGSYNTQAEWLDKISSDLTSAMTCADADVPYLTDLLVQVLGKLRQPYDGDGAAMPGPPQSDINAGPGLPGAPPPMPPGPMPPGPAGGVPMPGMIPAAAGPAQMASTNPDELRRILQP